MTFWLVEKGWIPMEVALFWLGVLVGWISRDWVFARLMRARRWAARGMRHLAERLDPELG